MSTAGPLGPLQPNTSGSSLPAGPVKGSLGARAVVVVGPASGGAGGSNLVAAAALRSLGGGSSSSSIAASSSSSSADSSSPLSSITVKGPSPISGTRQNVPDDGNCLFSALTLGLEMYQPYLRDKEFLAERITGEMIRNAVADTMASMLEENPAHIGAYLAGATLGVNERKIEEMEANKKYMFAEGFIDKTGAAAIDKEIAALKKGISPESYIANVREDRFWGGEIEIQAFAERFGMNVKVLEQKGKDVTDVKDTGLPVARPNASKLAALGVSSAEVPTIYLIASARHYDYFTPS